MRLTLLLSIPIVLSPTERKKQIFLREVAWELINILVFAMNDTIHFLISN